MMPVHPSAAAVGEPAAEHVAAADPVALAQLWADQFQHLATLGVAGAGGVLVLLQAQLIDTAGRWWLALVLFVLTAVFAMYGQIHVVDEATLHRLPGRRPRLMRGLALGCLGAAGGAALASLSL